MADVDVRAVAHTFAAGNRIRLDVTSSNFPKLDRNPNVAMRVAEATEADVQTASQTVYHDVRSPSRFTSDARGELVVFRPYPATAIDARNARRTPDRNRSRPNRPSDYLEQLSCDTLARRKRRSAPFRTDLREASHTTVATTAATEPNITYVCL